MVPFSYSPSLSLHVGRVEGSDRVWNSRRRTGRVRMPSLTRAAVSGICFSAGLVLTKDLLNGTYLCS